jgi:RHS repeat-associated protein
VATGSSTYNLTFSYDRYGNMACVTNGQTNGPCPNWTFSTNNRITTSGYTYDAAGNLTSDGTHTYQWDAEGHLTSVGTSSFTYNAYGWRVSNSSGSVSYLLDPSGQFLGGRWTNGGNSAVFLGSRMLAEYMSNGVDFDHPNVLGSDTQMTDYRGSGGQGILYYPWGQVWSNPSGLYPNTFYQRFASLQLYDTSTDGYVPPFRYYIPEQGRWLTPDPLAGDVTDPQSLNRYAYVGNNPTSFIDPSGLLGKCTYGGTWPRCNSRPHSTPYSPPPNPCPNGQWDQQTGVLICNPPQPPGPPQYGPPPQGAHVGGSGTPLATSQRNPAPEPALVRVDPLQDLALLAFGVKGLAALLDALLSEGSEEAVVLSEDRLTSILEKHTAEGVLSQGKKPLR